MSLVSHLKGIGVFRDPVSKFYRIVFNGARRSRGEEKGRGNAEIPHKGVRTSGFRKKLGTVQAS